MVADKIVEGFEGEIHMPPPELTYVADPHFGNGFY